MDSFDIVPADETPNQYFQKGVADYIAGKPYVILTTCSEWRRGWVAAEQAKQSIEATLAWIAEQNVGVPDELSGGNAEGE